MDLYMLIAICGVYVIGFVATSVIIKPKPFHQEDFIIISAASAFWPVVLVIVLPAYAVYRLSKCINQSTWGKE
jgi:hypothetical protein